MFYFTTHSRRIQKVRLLLTEVEAFFPLLKQNILFLYNQYFKFIINQQNLSFLVLKVPSKLAIHLPILFSLWLFYFLILFLKQKNSMKLMFLVTILQVTHGLGLISYESVVKLFKGLTYISKNFFMIVEKLQKALSKLILLLND